MEIKTKKVVESVTFTEEERQFMNNLADTIGKECENHFSCETCPFVETTCRACEDFIAILKNFASEERLEL